MKITLPSKTVVRAGLIVLVSSGISSAITYYVTKKNLETKYDKLYKEQIKIAKEYYCLIAEGAKYETPEEALREYMPDAASKLTDEIIAQYQGKTKANTESETPDAISKLSEEIISKYHGKTKAKTENERNTKVEYEEVVENDVYETFDEDEDEEEELIDAGYELVENTRSKQEKPYVITEEEFMINEDEYSQTTLTYYRGDGVLADERDQEIPLINDVVGERNLDRFGEGTRHYNIVHIRNDRLEADYEVLLHEGKYSYEVLGFEHADDITNRYRQDRQKSKALRGDSM